MQQVEKRRCNKWKKDEQQVERAGATGGDRMSNRWRMVSQQVEMGECNKWVLPASQPASQMSLVHEDIVNGNCTII